MFSCMYIYIYIRMQSRSREQGMPANEAIGIGGRSHGRIALYLPKFHLLKRFIHTYTYIYIYVCVCVYYGLEVLINIQSLALHLELTILIFTQASQAPN